MSTTLIRGGRIIDRYQKLFPGLDAMKTQLVQVGRSKAVKIPSWLLRKTQLPEEVEVTAVADSIVIQPPKKGKPRAGWSAAFARMRRNNDDKLLDKTPVSLSSWDEDEWQW